MTENKEERKKFKWGEDEYYLDDLLKLHAEQEHNFYEFARQRGQYDDVALQGLRQAMSNRISAVKNGKTFSADGVMDGDVADNTSITTKKGLFKKPRYVEQDNTEWAKYYLNQLVRSLSPIKKEDQKKHTNTDQFSFENYLRGSGLNPKYVFENYDLKNNDDPNAQRSFSERHQGILKPYLKGYLDFLNQHKVDFASNDNLYDDNTIAEVQDLYNNFDTLNSREIAMRLGRINTGDDYLTAFTSDKWDLSKSREDMDREYRKQQDENDIKNKVNAFNTFTKGAYEAFSAIPEKTAQMAAYLGEPYSNFYRTEDELREWIRNNKVDLEAYQKRYNDNRWDADAAQYVLPILQTRGALRETTIDGVKYVYDPASINRQSNTFIAIDPVTGTMYQKFLYDIESEMNSLKHKFLAPQGASKYQISLDKSGGILSMQSGGSTDIMSYLNHLDSEDYKNRSQQMGISEKELREKERTPLGKDVTVGNTQFTGNDIVQLSTMAVNLGSMLLDPVTGAVVGAGASLVDFGNDINRDGFQGKDLWNLVKNLGMDALGVIPVVGDTFGTLGKVKKALFNYVPKIIGWLGMAQGVSNSPQIIDSLSKILDDRDMTVQDWQNVANGINLVVSGTRMGKHYLKDAKAKQASLQSDKLQIEVVDKNNQPKILILDGDNAKAVRQSNHSVDEVNKILHDMEGMQDYNVSPKSSLFNYSLHMPFTKVKNEITGVDELVLNPFRHKAKQAIIQPYYDPKVYAETYGGSKVARAVAENQFNPDAMVDASGVQNLDQFKKAQQEAVDLDIKNLREKAEIFGKNRNKRAASLEEGKVNLENDKKALELKEQELTTATEVLNERQQTIDRINSWRAGRNKANAKTAITKATKEKTKLEAVKAALEITPKSKRSKAVKEQIAQLEVQIEAQDKIIRDKTSELAQYDDMQLQQAQRDYEAALQDKQRVKSDFDKIKNSILSTEAGNSKYEYQTGTEFPNSRFFNQLLNYSRPAVFNGVEYKFGPTTPYTKEGLLSEGLYKQGGPINRNKINKFLNYAKG